MGNGIERAFGNDSWGELISKFSRQNYRENEIESINRLPYPLRAVVATNDKVDIGAEEIAQKLLVPNIVGKSEIYKQIIGNSYDAILTTNYSYEIEKSLDADFNCGYKCRSKYRKTTKKGSEKDGKLGIFTFMDINCEKGNIPIWHIHGEAARPRSMILGHYYYGDLLGQIQIQVSNFMRNYHSRIKGSGEYTLESWIDYFLLGDIDIVGLSLDSSEMDLWWLIACKKRHNEEFKSEVYWYEANLNSVTNFSKKLLAEVYGIKVCSENINEGEYQNYYRNLVLG